MIPCQSSVMSLSRIFVTLQWYILQCRTGWNLAECCLLVLLYWICGKKIALKPWTYDDSWRVVVTLLSKFYAYWKYCSTKYLDVLYWKPLHMINLTLLGCSDKHIPQTWHDLTSHRRIKLRGSLFDIQEHVKSHRCILYTMILLTTDISSTNPGSLEARCTWFEANPLWLRTISKSPPFSYVPGI